MHVLQHLFIVLEILVVVITALLVWVVVATYQAEKLAFGLPWLRWFTLEEAVAMGFSSFWCKCLLPKFHQHGMLEVRIHFSLEKVPEYLHEMLLDYEIFLERREIPFNYETVVIHQFRLTKRTPRKRRIAKSKEKWEQAWVPVRI